MTTGGEEQAFDPRGRTRTRRLGDPTRGQVDHFVPWSRYPDDSLDNLVVADVACNGFKSSSLAAADHVARWARRLVAGSPEHRQLAYLAQRTAWEREPDKSASVARGIYLRLGADARLWLRRREFVDPDGARLAAVLHPPVQGINPLILGRRRALRAARGVRPRSAPRGNVHRARRDDHADQRSESNATRAEKA